MAESKVIASGTTGAGLLQSQEEWNTRNRILSDSLSGLINMYLPPNAERGLDVGCQNGRPVDLLSQKTTLTWAGVDPAVKEDKTSPAMNIPLKHGTADQIPFPDGQFDCVTLANVYEHILPSLYTESLLEIKRVLKPGGILVGQLPNPFFPIESHSRLPFMGYLPVRLQKAYWKLTPAPWEHDFYVVTIRDLRRRAKNVGFTQVFVHNFNYPSEVIPKSIRWAATLARPVMTILPWAWQFVFRK